MTEQVFRGDSTLPKADSQAEHSVNANMQRLANDFLDQGIHDATKGNATPISTSERLTTLAGDGLMKAPMGFVNAVVDDVKHPLNVAETLASSAAVGAGLKLILPETGMAGKVAGVGVAAGFMYLSREPFVDAYHKGMAAKTREELHAAGTEAGNAVGGFVAGSIVAGAGFRVGGGFAGKALASESMDGFALAKDKFWNPKGSEAHAPVDAIAAGADAPSMQGRVKIEGKRARLLDTERSSPKNATAVGDVDPNAPLDVTVYAQTKGSPLLMDRYIARIASGKAAPLTDAQITDKFGANPDSVKAIQKFADDHGLKVVEHNPASGRMQLSGTTEQMMKAFEVKLQEYKHDNGLSFRGRTGTLTVPTELAPNIKAVLGLDNRPQFKTNYVKGDPSSMLEAPAAAAGQPSGAVGSVEPRESGSAPAPKAGGARALEVEEVFKAYNADTKLDGKGMTTGFLSLGGTLPEGWQGYLKGKGLDPNSVEIRNTASSEPTPDPQGANGENALDLFIHKQGMPNAKTVMIQAENNDTGMPTGIDRMTFPKAGESQITHGSISWGMYEDGWTDQSRSMMEDAGKRAALKGITITVASGDNGAGDGSPSHKQQVDVPAGLGWFTASGGTRLTIGADGKWGTEVGWDGMGASGGGRSMKTPRPDFQKGLDLPPNLNGSTFDGRGVPDIAANADPRSGWIVFTDDGKTPIGGTSAAAPADAIKAAKISQATGKPTGFWNQEIYSLAKKAPDAFHDIVSGRNTDGGVKGYPAGKGWDAETGNGSIDVGNYILARNKMLNQGLVARNLSQIPEFVKQNQTNVPIWGIPYHSGIIGGTGSNTPNDSTK
ncbi:MAG: S53 family peptidase [Cyanobacteria bacterium REEB67]|nr:S53 family peptidase [Cyanobacteria bacterium REEB67]